METYFRIKTVIQFGIPALLILSFVALAVRAYVRDSMRSKLMVQLGYEFDKGLPGRVAYEFQPHWVKGQIRINCRIVSGMKYRRIQGYIKEREAKEN